jgi:hypothetical protein
MKNFLRNPRLIDSCHVLGWTMSWWPQQQLVSSSRVPRGLLTLSLWNECSCGCTAVAYCWHWEVSKLPSHVLDLEWSTVTSSIRPTRWHITIWICFKILVQNLLVITLAINLSSTVWIPLDPLQPESRHLGLRYQRGSPFVVPWPLCTTWCWRQSHLFWV